MPENFDATWFGARADEFIRSASVLCKNTHDGWLASSCLLLGFACELMAKRRLIHCGVPVDHLRFAPYGHDISKMWREKTSLFDEAEAIVKEFKRKPSKNGVDKFFNWPLHFEQLAKGHSREGDYSFRYHQGEIVFADPNAVTVVLAQIRRSEQ